MASGSSPLHITAQHFPLAALLGSSGRPSPRLAESMRIRTMPWLFLALLRSSSLCHCAAAQIRCFAMLIQSLSNHRITIPPLCRSILVNAVPVRGHSLRCSSCAWLCMTYLIRRRSKRSLAIPSPFAARRVDAPPRKAVSLQCRAWPCPCGSNQVSAKPLLCMLGYSAQCRCLSVRPAAVAYCA